MKRRIIAWTLAVMMAVSTMPVEIVAAGELENLPQQETVAEETAVVEETLPTIAPLSVEELPAKPQEESVLPRVSIEAPMQNTQEEPTEISSGTCGTGVNYTLYSDGKLVISGSGAMDNWYWESIPWYEYSEDIRTVVIESGVSNIGNGAFNHCNNLTSITIPNSVISIGDRSFDGCSNLLGISISNNVTSIGSYAFNDCGCLTNIEIPNSVATIGTQAFAGCNGLTSITIPNSVTDIEPWAFSGCNNLAKIIFPSDITTIWHYAFAGCSGLSSIDIPAGVISIEEGAFYQCSSLYSVSIPSSVASFGYLAFDETPWQSMQGDYVIANKILLCYQGEESTVTIPKAVTIISDYAFFNACENLKSVTILGNVDTIGKLAFAESTGLVNVHIFDGVDSIEEGAFQSCENLSTVTIPDSITSIKNYAFYNCKNLTDIYYSGTQAQWDALGVDTGATVHIAQVIDFGTCGTGVNYTLYSDGTLIISGEGAMENFSNGSAPWYNERASITAVEVQSGVTNVSNQAFYGCTALQSVTLADSVKSIGDSAFYDCSALTAIDLPDGLTGLGSYAFYNCKKLAAIELPAGVKSIGAYTFYYCESLKSADISGVTSLGDNAFEYCKALESIEIPEGVTSIPYYAFHNCSALANVTLPSTLKDVGYEAFYNCDSLISIVIPEGVTDINTWAFCNCDSLATVTIPSSVTNVNRAAFSGTALTSVYYLGTSQQWAAISIGSENEKLINAKRYYGPAEEEEADSVQLTVTACEHGSISLPNVSNVKKGGKVAIVVEPEKGYKLDHLTVDNGTANGNVVTVAREGDFTTVTVGAVFTKVNSSKTVKDGGACGDGVSWCLFTDGELVISGSGVMENFNNGSEPWLNYRSFIETVTVEQGVTSLGNNAFYHCVNLTTVTLPNTLTKIGEHAFDGDTSLVNIALPENLTYLGGYAFYQCSALQSIAIPAGVTSIENYYTFYECTSLKSVTLPDTMTSIGAYAFENCTALESIDLPENLSSISSAAFQGCVTLKEIAIPDGISRVPSNCFYRCTSLAEIVLPHTIQSIGDYAFYECSALKGIIIPDGTTTISYYAFYACNSLRYVVLPSSITSIGGDINGGARFPASITVYYLGTRTQWGQIQTYDTNLINATRYYVTEDDLLSVSVANCDHGSISADEITIKGGTIQVNVMPDEGYHLKSLTATHATVNGTTITVDAEGDFTSVEISATFEALRPGKTVVDSGDCGEHVSWYLYTDGELVISGSGTMTNYSTGSAPWYSYRSSIYSVTVEPGVTTVGSGAFYGCTNLTEVSLADSVTELLGSCFRECSKLTEIDLPANLASIGSYAFAYDTALTGIEIPASVEVIYNDTFWSCSSLNSVILHVGTNLIDYDAFGICSALQHVYYFGTATQWNNIFIDYSNTYLTNASRHYISSMDDVVEIRVTECEHGSIAAVGQVGIKGQSFTVTAMPEAGYRLKNLTVDHGYTNGNTVYVGTGDFTEITVGAVFEELRPGERIFDNGTCGALNWTLYQNGELVITGTGEMIFNNGNVPWSPYQNEIRTVTAEWGVTSVGEYAFGYCNNLKAVTLPNTISMIGELAFYGCQNLKYIDLPENLESIEFDAFCGCNNLQNVIFPEGLMYIGANAFADCFALTNVVIPESVVEIDGGAFQNCQNLQSVYMKPGVAYIGDDAFRYCYALTEVYLPNTVEYIGESAFANDTMIQDVYYFGTAARWRNIDIGSGNAYLKNANRHYIDSDTLVDVAFTTDGHGELGIMGMAVKGESFRVAVRPEMGYQLASLTATHATVNGTTVTVDTGDFDTVTLTATFEEVRPEKTLIDGGDCGGGYNVYWTLYDDGELVIYGDGAMENYWNVYGPHYGTPWNQYSWSGIIKSITVEPGVSYIGGGAFVDCMNADSISLPNTVTSIGYRAFQHCSGVETLTLPNSVTYISYNAFQYCYGLKSISVPSGVERIEEGTFANCDSLQNLNLPNSVTTIAYDAFLSCYALEEITMPESLAEIDISAIDRCSSLKTITFTGDAPRVRWSPWWSIPNVLATYPGENATWTAEKIAEFPESWLFISDTADGVELASPGRGLTACLSLDGTLTISGRGKITGNLNAYRSQIKKLIIEEGVTGIGGDAFFDCHNLTSVELPSTLTYIAGYAFYNCYNLPEIDVPDSVGYIDSFAFACCDNLETVTLHEGLEWIGWDAFAGCLKLQSITLPSNLTEIRDEAFMHGDSLTEITIPANVSYIGEGVFDYCDNLHTITFEGNAPENLDANAFYGVTATVYYPDNNASWSDVILDTYGGDITWESYSALCDHTYSEDWSYDASGHWHACTKCGGADQVQKHTYVTQIINPTLTEQGYTIYTCSVCGYSYCDDYVGGSGSGNGTIRLVDSLACAGDTITVKVNLEENPGINTFTLGFDYDDSLLTLISMEGVEELEEIGDYAFGTKAVWFSNSDTIYTGRILTATFKVTDGVDPEDVSLTVTYTPGDISNFAEEDINPVVVPGVVSVVEYKAGDINGDGTLNGKDLTRMSKFLAGYDDPALESALDVTGDGVVNAMDLIRLMKYLSGQNVVIQ